MAESVSKIFAGVYPILTTPFYEDGSVDMDSQLRLVDYLLEKGAHGLGLFGNASEGYALSGSERQSILASVVKRVNGRVPLIISSGHTGTDVAVQISREARDMGGDALMVLPPYYMKTDGDGLLHYFGEIARGAGIPIMVQDAPLMTQVAMPAGLLTQLSLKIDQVQLVKVEAPPTSPKITALKNAGCKAELFGGLNGQFLIEEYERGSRGVMPGSDLIPEFVSIWHALEAGENDRAWVEFVHILPLIRFELQPGLGVSAMKHNLVARGIIESARVRHPTASLDSQSVKELARLRAWVDKRGITDGRGERACASL
jgi:2-keto-3-deoxy-L-arabinonate dehydratase